MMSVFRKWFGGGGKGHNTKVTAEQMGAILATAAFKSAFEPKEGLADKILDAEPEVEDSFEFRTELLILCLLPLDMIATTVCGAAAPVVREAMLSLAAGYLESMLDQPVKTSDSSQMQSFLDGRLASYGELLAAGGGMNSDSLMRFSLFAAENVCGGKDPLVGGLLATSFMMSLKHMPEAIGGYRIVD